MCHSSVNMFIISNYVFWEGYCTVQTNPGDHPGSYTVGTGSLAGIKWPERAINHQPSSSAEVTKIVELYF
jgi:hypothetical protein